MTLTRRQFFLSLAASALAAGATMPVAFPKEQKSVYDDWLGAFAHIHKSDRNASFLDQHYVEMKQAKIDWRNSIKDDAWAAMRQHGLAT